MSATCIFCPNEADSKEHVWPEWLLDLLSQGKRREITIEMGRGGVKKWSGPSAAIDPRIVCEDCNSKWMSRLETQAKPIISRMLDGSPIELSMQQGFSAGLQEWKVK